MKTLLPERVDMLSCALPYEEQLALSSGEEEVFKAIVEQQVQRCLAHARQYWPTLPDPKIQFDLKGRSAGQAHFGRPALRFNLVLLKAQPHAFIEDIVPHEVAHWVDAYGVALKGKPHGPVWRWLMMNLYGRKPNVTHRFDTEASRPTPWHYGCHCLEEHRLTVHRHRRIERGHTYRCRRCGQQLRLLGCEPEA